MSLLNRRSLLKKALLSAGGLLFCSNYVHAKTYMSVSQAKKLLVGNKKATRVPITLTSAQMKSIRAASKVRIRNPKVSAWKTSDGGWFIVDQVIGKHENIDVAFALDKYGKVRGIEVLVYRETYGSEIRNRKWTRQFWGKDHRKRLKLGRDIKNISGATLSCKHITEGINRINQLWYQVLRFK